MVTFEAFTRETVRVADVRFNVLHAGSGPPLLLLHGYPQTSLAWRRVAPALAGDHHVIVPDLPGYGDSPIDEPDRFDFSKRHVGERLLELVRCVHGPARPRVVGHDRGARVAYRLCLDRPEAVAKACLLDILPTIEMAESLDWRGGLRAYHWFFLAQPHPLPERLIGGDPSFYVRHTIASWTGVPGAIEEAALAAYAGAFQRESVVHAACADYRAGLSADLEHDAADRRHGRRIGIPVRVLNAARYLGDADRVRSVWSRWAADFDVVDIDCGHFVMEEAPEETLRALRDFL